MYDCIDFNLVYSQVIAELWERLTGQYWAGKQDFRIQRTTHY